MGRLYGKKDVSPIPVDQPSPTPHCKSNRTETGAFSSAIHCDYRNPIIAEAMKVLGYVNCYNRGINMVQDELEANGNGKAEFSFRLITAFEAKVAKAGQQQELDQSKQDSSMKRSMKSSMKSEDRLLDLLAIQGTLKSLFHHHSSKASILWLSPPFMVRLSYMYKC